MEKKHIVTIVKNSLFITSFFATSFVVAKQQQTLPTQLLQVTHKNKHPWDNKTFRVKDENNQEYILKQHYNPQTAIHETVFSNALKEIGINTNAVKIIPAHHALTQKLTPVTTTLHTLIPGTDITNMSTPHTIDLENTLTDESNLQSIADNKKLAEFAAANIYFNDRDGNPYNVFFHEETNQFYIIDKSEAFSMVYSISNDTTTFNTHTLLATATRDFLKQLKKEDLSPEKINALKCLNKTLGKLMYAYSPITLHNKWMNVAKEINYDYSPSKQNIIRNLLERNFDETKHLCFELNRLTQKPFSIKSIFERMAAPSKKAHQDFWRTMNS